MKELRRIVLCWRWWTSWRVWHAHNCTVVPPNFTSDEWAILDLRIS